MRDAWMFWALFATMISLGGLSIVSLERVDAGQEEASQELNEARLSFSKIGEFQVTHNEVYQKIGEERWTEEHLPEYFRRITLRTIQDTGNPFPTTSEILDWAEKNPDEANQLILNPYPNGWPSPDPSLSP